MDSREAREILRLFRPGSTDAADPRVAEALDQARSDPGLTAWLEQQASVNVAVRAKLKAIPVPPGLKREIIINRAEHSRVVPLPATVKLLAVAAAVGLLVAIGWFSFRKEPSPYEFENYRDRVTHKIQRNVNSADLVTANLTEILDYCQKRGSPTDFTLPAKLQSLAVVGGSAFTWSSRPVTMLCLDAGTAAAPANVWVFVIEKSAVVDAPPAKPEFLEVGNLMTASWTAGGKVFVLAGVGNQSELQKFLEE